VIKEASHVAARRTRAEEEEEDGIYSELSSQLPMLLEERKAYDGGRDVRGANDLKVR